MLEALLQGLVLVFQWPAIGFLVLGVLIGIWLGAVPGLGGLLGMVILLPFTYGMDSVSAFALLLGMYAVTATSDTIASVMLGIPGTAASQATILDGYPLAQQGHARRALGAAFTVSAFGGVLGGLVLAVSLPIVLPMIMAFGSSEFFALGVLGLAMVGSLAGGSILKGLTMALLGLFISMVGFSPTVSEPRFAMDIDYLIEGVQLIPIVLGLFALPELMELAVRNVSISRVPEDSVEGGGLMDGVRDAIRHWWLATRCAFIGIYIGILPGLGASIVDWMAYGHAVQSAKDKSMFGRGDIRGVIAPESANNAQRGGSLIPTVAFGIPGSASMAILLGALLIQGLKPGVDMLTLNLHVTFSMVWTIIIANLLVVALLFFWSKPVAKAAHMPGHLLVPGVVVFVFMGAWMGGSQIGDWYALLIAAIAGFLMKRGGWARPPLVLGLVLGNIMETNFQRTLGVWGWTDWMTRPIVVGIMVLIAITVFLAARGIINARRAPGDAVGSGEGAERNPILSLPFTLLMLALFGWACWSLEDIPPPAWWLPSVTIVPALVFLVFILLRDSLDLRAAVGAMGSVGAVWRDAVDRHALVKAGEFLAWLIGIVVVAEIAGQFVALTLFVAFYLWRWGHYNWMICVVYAAGALAFLWGFYDQVLDVLWNPSLLFG